MEGGEGTNTGANASASTNTDSQEVNVSKGAEAVEAVETAEVVSPYERMKKMERFKDKTYENSDQALAEVLDAFEEVLPKSEEAERMKNEMLEVFKKHREIPYLIKIAEEMGDFHPAILSLYDNDEDMLLREGDEGYEKLKKMRSDRIERAEMEQELLNKYNSNMESFPKKFDDWSMVRKLTDGDKDGMYSFLDDMLVKLVSGDVDEDVLDKVYQAYTYKREIGNLEEDEAIAKANAEGAGKKPAADILPIPESTSPAKKPTVAQQKTDPFTADEWDILTGKKQ